MDQNIMYIIEFLGVLLGGTIAIVRLLPTLRQAAIFLQIALFLTQIFGFYMKRHPEKREELRYFVTQAINHYLRTHPEGQEVAKHTDIDERVQKFIGDTDPTDVRTWQDSINRLFRVKVDNK